MPIRRGWLSCWPFLAATLLAPSADAAGITELWNSFLGGPGTDEGRGISVDASGNAYVVGTSSSTWGSPRRAHRAGDDAFVAKLDASGVLVWNTFLGASGADLGFGIALDTNGNAYVTGWSDATWGSPLRAFRDNQAAFVAKLDANGALLWNTFFGASGDAGLGIAVDGNGNALVTGWSGATWGSPRRAFTANNVDSFVAKLDPSGALLWNTFLGGSGFDQGSGIALDGSGNTYVTGLSETSWGSPLRAYTPDYLDAFVAKVDASGALLWNTFLGALGHEATVGAGIAVDGSGNVYAAGFSSATWGSPVRGYSGGPSDGFVARIDASGALLWNTFLGGVGFDRGADISTDRSGNVYVAGRSEFTWGEPVRPFAAEDDAFAAKVDSGGALVWNAFLGAPGFDFGNGIAVDAGANVYVTGFSNATWGSPERAHSSDQDAFAAKIGEDPPTSPVCIPNATAMCLNNDRFKVEATFRTGTTPLTLAPVFELTNDTGYFWFFSSTNVEVLVKVLNACALPASERYWVFAGGLTNVEVNIRVTDTETGAVRTYRNPGNRAFLPIQDTNAFATCP